MKIRDYLKEHILIMDGAMGTYFDSQNSENGRVAEDYNLLDPEKIKSIHMEYLQSGANLLRTNTFAVNRGFALTKGYESRKKQNAVICDSIRSACRIAESAIKESGMSAWIAADIGPIAEYLFHQYDFDEKEEYRLLIDAFLECGIEIFDFETFPDLSLIRWAAEYIKQKNPDAFIMASFALNRTGYTSKGFSVKRLFAEAAQTDSIDCYGCNCLIGASHMYDLLKNQTFAEEKYIMALPNSGYPQILRGRAIYSDGAKYFADKMLDIADLGLNILGGCCGTTPQHIRALSKILNGKKPVQKKETINSVRNVTISKTKNNPFIEKLEKGETVIAVELDPPFDQNEEKLLEGSYQLKHQNVDIITLADSPLGRSRADSFLLASRIHNMVDIPVMPHIACRDRNRISMHSTILGAHINGIRNMLIVTGDPVPTGERNTTKAVFDFNSIKFMNYVKEINQELFVDDAFSYGGALNQNQANLDKVIERMQKKIDAGVSYFLTQPIYSDSDVERIKEMKAKLNTKILCGIMPLVSYRNALFIKNEMPGIFVPDEVVAQYDPDMTRYEAEAVAKTISLDMIQKLKGIADGYYFMTPFNRVQLICDIIEQMEDYS
ncbi:MAG: bifunctional homocysteine S-methyltransferase/methylenetetrahydrofolate reductase [Lachnospiraceae bacterium]|nr:bifunctional homocysteine S-methyltransferase/methylenetetrahydrofolate reductase [Lachnospiraceae bacterium]